MTESAGWVKHVFIDESGDLGKFGSKYFTIAGIFVDRPKALAKIIKKLRQRKLKKKLKQLPELKANKSPPEVREFVLKKVAGFDCKIFAVVVDKSMIYDYLFSAKDKLYNYLCGVLLSFIPLDKGRLVITIDKKHGNTALREEFGSYIRRRMWWSHPLVKIEIYHLPSHARNELQVADFVAWCINRKYNTGDERYFEIVEEKIVNKERMLLWKQ